jgi:branched-chain amino acid transport system permease protein
MTSLLAGISQEVISGIALGCIYALVALGFTLIYKATKVVNFAQGELMLVGAYVNFYLVMHIGGSSGDIGLGTFLLAFLLSLVFAIVFGVVLDYCINRPLKDEPIFSVIMATISFSIILRSLVSLFAGPMSLVPRSPFGDRVFVLGSVVISSLDLTIILCAVILVSLFYYFFKRTRWGIAMQATAEDLHAAQLMGIPVKKVYQLVWVFSTLVATVGGILLAPRMSLLDVSMSYFGLKAFPAAILGGFGSIRGAIIGGVLLGVIETISMGTLSFHFSWIKEINDIIVWIVLIAVLLVKPAGLLGKEELRRV